MRLLCSKMGCRRDCCCRCRLGALAVLLLLLLLLVFVATSGRLTEGRAATLSSGPSKEAAGGYMAVVRVERIGSTPPRCDRKCSSCGPCEPIQVPANPQENEMWAGGRSSTRSYVVGEYYSRDRGDDDSSNYKPMSWKCKCGKFIFNP